MISFDLSDIPQDATIASAKLEIHHSSFSTSPSAYNTSGSIYETNGTFYIHKVTKSWTESALSSAQTAWANYNSSINTTEEDSFEYLANSITWAEFDLTSAISDMHSGAINNDGFMIITDSPRADQAASSNWWGGLWTYWQSSESSNSSYRPKLIIEYSGGTDKKIVFQKETKGVSINFTSKNKLNITDIENGLYQITVYSASGKKLVSKRQNLSSRSTVHFNNITFATGAYVIKLKGDKAQIISRKIVF